MNFLSLIEDSKQQAVVSSGSEQKPGKGKKQCISCKNYCGARCKSCPNCEFNFETKQSSLFSQKSIKELEINNENIIQWILMCSYIYYIKNEHLIPDEKFDKLIEILKIEWDQINHRHKNLIKSEGLTSNSLFYLKEEDYPQIIKHSALRHLKAMKKFKCSIEEVIEKKLFNKVTFNEFIW